MDNDKSILEKIADTVKDIATLASDAASHALQAEEPPLKAGEQPAVAYMPLAGDALVSDYGAFRVRDRLAEVPRRIPADDRACASARCNPTGARQTSLDNRNTSQRGTQRPSRIHEDRRRSSPAAVGRPS